MSKAFTKEDSVDEPPLKRPLVRVPAGALRYITPKGFEKLTAALNALRMRWDAAKGAVPEEAKRLEAQVAELTAIHDAVTVGAVGEDPSRAFLGASVELEDDEGQRASYQLVGPDELNVKEHCVSVDSPVARALLGKQVGDAVEVERPAGRREYTVTAIRY